MTYLDAILSLRPGAQVAIFRPYGYADIDWGNETPIPQAELDAEILRLESLPPVPVIPQSATMRQARLALLGAGLLAHVNAAIEAMPGIEGEAARIEWEFASEIRRDSPLVVGLSGALGLSSEQMDELFRQAAML